MKYLITIIIFFTISSVYFYPSFKGYGLYQTDIKKHLGMSKEIEDYRYKYGGEPLWTNSMFSGMPAYQISTQNPNLLARVEFLVFKIIPVPVYLIFLLMIGFYILLDCFNLKFWLKIIGSVAFGLASFNFLYLAAGHNAKIHTLAYLSTIIGGIIYAYRKNYLIGSVILAISLSLFIAAGHIQIMYYSLFIILAIVIEEFFRLRKRLIYFLKASVFLLIAGLLVIISNASMLFITHEYSKHTTRGKSELTVSPKEIIKKEKL